MCGSIHRFSSLTNRDAVMKRLFLYIVVLTLFACSSCDVYEHSDKRLKALEQQEQTEEVVQQEAYHKMTKDWIMMLYCSLIIVGVGGIVCYLLFAWHSARMGKKIEEERRERTRLQEDYEQQLAHISERIKDKGRLHPYCCRCHGCFGSSKD